MRPGSLRGGLLSRTEGGVLRAEERGYLRRRELVCHLHDSSQENRGGMIPTIQPDQVRRCWFQRQGHLPAAGSLLSRWGDPPSCGGQTASDSASQGLAVRSRLGPAWCGVDGSRRGLWASTGTSLPGCQGLCGWRWEFGDTSPLSPWPCHHKGPSVGQMLNILLQ